jgi:HemY protein
VKALVYALLFLAAGMGLALYAVHDPGHVLIARGPWQIEMSLGAFLLLLALGFMAFYFLLRAALRLWHGPRDFARWRDSRRRRRARRELEQGLLDLYRGDGAPARRQPWGRPGPAASESLIGALTAAWTAQARGETESRDRELARAYAEAPESRGVIALTEARLRMETGEWQTARTLLEELRDSAPYQIDVLRLLARVYEKLEDWPRLIETANAARRHGALSAANAHARLRRAHVERLKQEPALSEDAALHAYFRELPRALRRDGEVIAAYAERAVGHDDQRAVETVLRRAVDAEFEPRLVRLYGLLRTANPVQQLKTAERWAREHPEDPILLLSLGRISLANRLWGKARAYLEASVARNGPPEAHYELGRLLERLGENDTARALFGNGLIQAGHGSPLPAPEAAIRRAAS